MNDVKSLAQYKTESGTQKSQLFLHAEIHSGINDGVKHETVFS